jgi:hypothetical protein
MGHMKHPTEEQFDLYCGRRLEVAQLLEIDDHLASCGECRRRMAEMTRAGRGLDELAVKYGPPEHHLNYEEVVAAAERGEASGRLESCALCRREVDELRDFRVQLKRARAPRRAAVIQWTRWGAIAAVVALVAAATMLLSRKPVGPQVASVPDEYREALRVATAEGRLTVPPQFAALRRRSGTLLGPAGPVSPSEFRIKAPAGTAVLEATPVFDWESPRGAMDFVVSIFNSDYQKVAESQPLATNQWRSETPLPPGVYSWQVTARFAGGVVRFPQPPAAEAVFAVLDRGEAAAVERLAREHPDSHSLLAVAYAQHGLLDLASKEVDAAERAEPASETPRRWRESLSRTGL